MSETLNPGPAVVPDVNAEFLPPIPPAVRRQAERAQQAFDRQKPAATPVVTPPATPAPPAPPAAVTPPAPQPPVAPLTPPPVPPEPTPDYEQLYKTLKGRWDAQVPQLQSQLRLANEELDSLRAVMGRMNSMPAATPAAVTLPAPDAEDVETYGEELIQKSRGWAMAAMKPELDALRTELAQVRGTAQQVQTTTAQQAVRAALDGAVPDWQTIDQMQSFFDWLKEIDPFSGGVRHAMMDTAYKRGESARVIAFYEAFKRELSATTPSPGPTPPAPVPPGPAIPLETLAAPGTARHAGGGAPEQNVLVWTKAQITAFYRDKQNGKFAGREAEANRLEQDIVNAGREGRVQ